MGAQGTASLDFGAFPGSSITQVDVNSAGIISTSAIEAWIRPVTTADHTDIDHIAAPIRVTAMYLSNDNMRIFGINQVDFPLTMPVLQLLFARNGSLHRAEQFKVDQPVNRIFGSMPRRKPAPMLRQSFQQVRSHADVERAVKLARKNIYARLLFLSHRRSLAAKWALKQVQGDGVGNK